MKYDWENEIQKRVEAMQCLLPDHLELIAVAVHNTEQGEGALVDLLEGYDSYDVTDADIRKDILADADRQYEAVKAAAFGGFKPRRAN